MTTVLATPQFDNYGADFLPTKPPTKPKTIKNKIAETKKCTSRRAAGCKKPSKRKQKKQRVSFVDRSISISDSTDDVNIPTYNNHDVLAPVSDTTNIKELQSGNFDVLEVTPGMQYVGNNTQYKSLKFVANAEIKQTLIVIEAVEFNNANTMLTDLSGFTEMQFNRCIFRLNTTACGHACVKLSKADTKFIDCTFYLNVDNEKAIKIGPNALFISSGCNVLIDTSTFYVVYNGSKADIRVMHINRTEIQSKIEIKRCTLHADFKCNNAAKHNLTFLYVGDGAHSINVYDNAINANTNVNMTYISVQDNSKESKIIYDNNKHSLSPSTNWTMPANNDVNYKLFNTYNPNPIAVGSNYNVTDKDRAIVVKSSGELVLPPSSKVKHYIDVFAEANYTLKDPSQTQEIAANTFVRLTPAPRNDSWIIIKS